MAGTVQCVILIDESALCRLQSVESESEDSSQLRLAILRILCFLGSNRSKSGECLRWGYKFFNSLSTRSQSMDRWGLFDFNLESFEEFEAKLVLRTLRLREVQALELTRSTAETCVGSSPHQTEVLRVAFKQLYADYSWDTPDISSPVKCKLRRKSFVQEKQDNSVWLFASFHQFLTVDRPGDPFKYLLPKSLHSALAKLGRLFWVDTASDQTLATDHQRLSSKTRILSVCSLTGTEQLFPLSSLLDCSSVEPSPAARKSPSHVQLQLPQGKALCQICLSAPWGFSSSSLEPLPQEVRIRGSILASRCVAMTPRAGCFLGWSSQADAALRPSQAPFAGLLRHLTSQGRLLVLGFQSLEKEFLWLLRPLGCRACALLPLPASMTLQLLVNAKPCQAKVKGRPFLPSVLERWAVPDANNCLQGEPSLKRPSPVKGKKDVQLRLNCHQRLSSIFASSQMATSLPQEAATFKTEALRQEYEWTAAGDGPSVTLDGSTSFPSDLCLSASQDDKDVGKTFEQLRTLYKSALEGAKSLESAAEFLSQSLHSLAQPDCDALTLGRREKLLLSARDIGKKREASGDAGDEMRQREHRLQILLLLELASKGEGSVPLHASLLQEIVVLLRTFSFLAGARELNRFLHDTLKDRYGNRLRSLLEEIGEELNVPLFSSSSGDESGEEVQQTAPPSASSSMTNSSVCSSVSNSTNSRPRWGRAPSLLSVPAGRRQIQVPKSMLPAKPCSNNNNKGAKGRQGKEPRSRSPVKKLKRDWVRRNLFQKTKSESHISIGGGSSSQRSPQKKKMFTKPIHKGISPRSGNCKSAKRKSMVECSPRTPRGKSRFPSKGFTPNDKFPELVDTPGNQTLAQSPAKTPQAIGKRSNVVGFTPDAKFPDLLQDSPASCTRSKSAWSPSPLWKTPTSSKTSRNSVRRLSQRSRSTSCIRNLNLDLDNASPSKSKAGLSSPDKRFQKNGISQSALGSSVDTPQKSPKLRSSPRTPCRTPQKYIPSHAGLYSPMKTPQKSPQFRPIQRTPSRTTQKYIPSKAGVCSPVKTPRKSNCRLNSPHKHEMNSPSSTPQKRKASQETLGYSAANSLWARLQPPNLSPKKSILKNGSKDLKVSPDKLKEGVCSSPSRAQPHRSFKSQIKGFQLRSAMLQSLEETENPRLQEPGTPKSKASSKRVEVMQELETSPSKPSTSSRERSPSKQSPEKSKWLPTSSKLFSTPKKAISCQDLGKSLEAVSMPSDKLSTGFFPTELTLTHPKGFKALPEVCNESATGGSKDELSPREIKLSNIPKEFQVSVCLRDIMLEPQETYLNGGDSHSTFPNRNLNPTCSIVRPSPNKKSWEPDNSNIVQTTRESGYCSQTPDETSPSSSSSTEITWEGSPAKSRKKREHSESNTPNIVTSERETPNHERNTTPKKACPINKGVDEEPTGRLAPKTSPILSMRWPIKKRKLSPKCSVSRPDPSSDYLVQLISPPPKRHLSANRGFKVPSDRSLFHLTTSPVLSVVKQDSCEVVWPRTREPSSSKQRNT